MFLIFDTNVLLYLRGSKNNSLTIKAREILKSIKDKKHIGVLTPPIIMEVYYLVSDSDSEIVASDFIKNLLSMEGIMPFDITRDMGKFAGELYFKYNRTVKNVDPNADCPSAADCLLCSVNKFLPDSIICSNDRNIKGISEVKTDFFQIKTN